MPDFVRYGTRNLVLPKEGPLAFPFYVDFSTRQENVVDLTIPQDQGQFEFVQGWFLDNSKNANDITVRCDNTNQPIRVPALKQAYMPQFVADVPRFTLVTPQAAGLVIYFAVTNVPVTPYIW